MPLDQLYEAASTDENIIEYGGKAAIGAGMGMIFAGLEAALDYREDDRSSSTARSGAVGTGFALGEDIATQSGYSELYGNQASETLYEAVADDPFFIAGFTAGMRGPSKIYDRLTSDDSPDEQEIRDEAARETARQLLEDPTMEKIDRVLDEEGYVHARIEDEDDLQLSPEEREQQVRETVDQSYDWELDDDDWDGWKDDMGIDQD